MPRSSISKQQVSLIYKTLVLIKKFVSCILNYLSNIQAFRNSNQSNYILLDLLNCTIFNDISQGPSKCLD